MNLLRAIRQGVWMVDEATKDAYLPLVLRLLKGEPVSFDIDKNRSQFRYLSMDGGSEYPHDQMPEEREASLIAVYPIIGMITKYDQDCGAYGTETLMRRMRKMDAKPSVKAHVLEIDSGGGQGANIEIVAQFIRNEVKKPVVAWFNNINASAAYYISAACDEVYASQATDLVGSIGALSSWVDIIPYLEAQGYVYHEIYADQSELKNKEMRDAEAGDYKAWKATILNPTAAQFIATVKAFRPQLSDMDAYKGKLYNASEAVQISMLDGIKTFEQAVQRASELADQRKISNNFNMNSTNLTAALGVLEHDDKGGIYLNAAQIAALDAFMSQEQQQHVAEGWKAGMDTSVGTLQHEMKALREETTAKMDEAATKLTELNNQLAEIRTELAATQEKIESFGKQPGSGRTLGYAKEDKPLIADGEDEDELMKMEKAHAEAAASGAPVRFE